VKKKTALALIHISLIALSIISVQPIKAVPKTIIVPADYPTIVAAIGNATDGDTILVRKGTYEEHSLMINKTLTLIGEDSINTIITNIDDPIPIPGQAFLAQPTIAVQINADNAKITGFTIASAFIAITASGNGNQITGNIVNGEGEGINLNGDSNTVARNNISAANGFIACTGSYNTVAGNSLSGRTSPEGLVVDGSFNVVYGNLLTDCGGFGSIDVNGDGNMVAKNTLTNSGGIFIERGSNNVVCANIIDNNIAVVGYNNTFYANYAHDISIGSRTNDAVSNTFYHNNFTGNAQIWSGVQGPNYFDNGKEGNFWSDYNGTDADGDGIGDTPYVIDASRQDHYPLMAPFDIDSVTVPLPQWANIPSSPSPSQEPTSTPEPKQPISIPTIWIVAIAALVAVVIVELIIIYFLKVKRTKSQ
jgi:hypothetical protein